MARTTRQEHEALLTEMDDPEVRALFPYQFLVATEIFDELVDAAAWRILSDAHALPGAGGGSPERTLAERGFPARALPALRFLHAKLASRGALRREGELFFTEGPPEGSLEGRTAELVATAPESAVGAEIVQLLVDEAPGFFAGETTGEQILFAPTRLPLWFRYFSNANGLYALNNRLGALAAARAAPERADVLEIGGGAGSAAEELLSRLGARAALYRFTELVPTFLRRGERAARAAASPETRVEAARLDMTKPWDEQGVSPASFDLVYSVNCFHVAPDLDAVLREAERALKPGGSVVVSECVRADGSTLPIYVELIFDFLESFTNVKTDPDRRPVHGFLTPASWRKSFAAAGLADVAVLPDVNAVAARYPRFFVGAVVARRVPAGPGVSADAEPPKAPAEPPSGAQVAAC